MSYLSPVSSCADATALGRADTVVRAGRDVLGRADLEAGSGQGADRGLATGTGPLDEDVDLAHAVLHGAAGGGLGGHLGGVRGGLARSLEADLARGGPGDHGTGGIGDRDDGGVERALDVGRAHGHILLDLATHLGGAGLGGHVSPTKFFGGSCSPVAAGPRRRWVGQAFFLPATVRFGPLRVRALVLVR